MNRDKTSQGFFQIHCSLDLLTDPVHMVRRGRSAAAGFAGSRFATFKDESGGYMIGEIGPWTQTLSRIEFLKNAFYPLRRSEIDLGGEESAQTV